MKFKVVEMLGPGQGIIECPKGHRFPGTVATTHDGRVVPFRDECQECGRVADRLVRQHPGYWRLAADMARRYADLQGPPKEKDNVLPGVESF